MYLYSSKNEMLWNIAPDAHMKQVQRNTINYNINHACAMQCKDTNSVCNQIKLNIYKAQNQFYINHVKRFDFVV